MSGKGSTSLKSDASKSQKESLKSGKDSKKKKKADEDEEEEEEELSSKRSKKDKKDKDGDDKKEKKSKESKELGDSTLKSSFKDKFQGLKAKPVEYDDDREYTKYFEKEIYPIIHRMKADLVNDKPRDLIEFCLEWIDKEKRGENKSRVSRHEKDATTNTLSIAKTSGSASPAKKAGATGGAKGKNETKAQLPVNRKPTNTQSDDEDEDAADPEFINKMKRRRDASQELHRKGVSAEVYGKYNKRTDFKPVVIKKDAEQKKRIMDRINVNVFLKGLGDEDKEIIVNAMKEVKFKKGEKVIQQGDTGDDFYVIDSGEVDCLRSNKPGESARYLKTYVAGEGFGELALLYNAPRAATLVCKTPCTLFALDRQTFNHVVRESTIKKRQRYEEIINHIELLNGMENYEKQTLIDSLHEELYRKGTEIIQEGEIGNKFYFIEKGEAKATKIIDGKEVEVMKYSKGDYFGELALLQKDSKRKATITAVTDCVLMCVDREGFTRILGPLDTILKRNMIKYEKYTRIKPE